MYLSSCRAWFYKSIQNCEVSHFDLKLNPIHNHNPSFLSGVFYLDVPKTTESKVGGTVFINHSVNNFSDITDVEIPPHHFAWTIFPGWLHHRTGNYETKDKSRYVIAADSYFGIIN